jgi:GGDEF domain-containing protein
MRVILNRLLAAVRNGAEVAGIGSEEFAIIAQGADRASASEITQRVAAPSGELRSQPVMD